MKLSYKVILPPSLYVSPYINLFAQEYNQKYLNSYAVVHPYKEKDGLRSRNHTQCLVFYNDTDVQNDEVQKQIADVRHTIKENLLKIVSEMSVDVKKTTFNEHTGL